jgi:hypothetical protein
MEPLSFLVFVPFVLALLVIKNYRWFADFYYRRLASRGKQIGFIELKAGIIASSIFIMLWCIIGFVLLNH